MWKKEITKQPFYNHQTSRTQIYRLHRLYIDYNKKRNM